MENENPLEESKKELNKKAKQDTVLTQLNNHRLYPLQERIGIYVIAALSAIGLLLITYTGVMAVVSNVTNVSGTVDVDVDELADMLDDLDLDELIGSEVEDEEPSQDDDDLHQYVDVDDEDDEDVDGEDDTEPETNENAQNNPTVGTINSDNVSLLRTAGSTDPLDNILLLQVGDQITLIDLDYNPFWAQIEIESTAIPGLSVVSGFIPRDVIDID
jgi:hypothetical protein